MSDNLSKFIDTLSGTSKFVTQQVIHCQYCGGAQVDAIVSTFEDGYTDVSCEYFDCNEKKCFYKRPSRPVRFSRQPLVIIGLALALAVGVTFLAAWLYPMIKHLSHT